MPKNAGNMHNSYLPWAPHKLYASTRRRDKSLKCSSFQRFVPTYHVVLPLQKNCPARAEYILKLISSMTLQQMSGCRKSSNTGTSVAGKSWLGVLSFCPFLKGPTCHSQLARPVRAAEVEALGGWDRIDDGERSDKKMQKMVDLCR